MDRLDLEIDLQTLLDEVSGRWVGPGSVPRRPVTGISTDSRSLAPGEVFFALGGERFDGHDFVGQAVLRGASACLVKEDRTAALSGPLISVNDPLEALEALASWRRRSLSFEVTAVTGSVGKTTTKEFLRSLLAVRFPVKAAPRSFNNRLGVSLTLITAERATRQMVVEMGTSAPGEISHLSKLVRPERALITQIAAAHLSGLRDLEGVIAAKAEIMEGLSDRSPCYLNVNLPDFDAISARAPGPVRTFGWGAGDYAVTGCRPVDVPARRAGGERPGFAFEIHGRRLVLPVVGRHNVLNASASVAVARDLGMEWDEIQDGLLRCELPPGRLHIESRGDIVLLDDSYNANPVSMTAAIETLEDLRLEGRRVAVLGDMLELGDAAHRLHEDVGRRAAGARVDLLVTIGSESRFLSRGFTEELRGRPRKPECLHFTVAREAFEFLTRRLRPGDAVLLKGSNQSGIKELAAELRCWAVAGGDPSCGVAAHERRG